VTAPLQDALVRHLSPDERLRFPRRRLGNQEQTNRYFGTLAGTVSIPEFFSPQNVGRIMAAAGPRETAQLGTMAAEPQPAAV
jgi:hypothetical protein